MSANPAQIGIDATTVQRAPSLPLERARRMTMRTLYRPHARPAVSESPATAQHIEVELAGWDVACRHQQAWTDLAARSGCAHAFLTPAFALTAAQHFAPADRPAFLLVWQKTENGAARLTGLFAFSEKTAARSRILRLWHTPQDTLAAPLMDPDAAAATLDAVYAFVRETWPHVEAVLYREIETDGADTLRIEQHALDAGLKLQRFDAYARASLALSNDTDSGTQQAIAAHISRKKRKEYDRQYRRLADKGELRHRIYNSSAAMRPAIEQFLALEASGWKGKHGNPLLAEPSLATFTRTMTRRLAAEGNCEIHALELDGKPIAMALLLRAGNRAWFWKTAFDEAHAAQSPGVQLTLAMSRELAARKDLTMIDSCAVADHSMIDALWPGRVRINDLLVSMRPGERQQFRRLAQGETRRRKLRAIVKSIYHRLRAF